jgi:hypothetical protein
VPVTEVELPPDCALTPGIKTRERTMTKAAASGFLQEASIIPPNIFQESENTVHAGVVSVRGPWQWMFRLGEVGER